MSSNAKLETVEMEAGTVLFRQDDPATAAFLLESATVSLTRRVHREEFVLEEVGPGALVGEMALVDGGHHIATATLRTSGKVLRIPHDSVAEVLENNPRAARRIIAKLGLRLATAQYRMSVFTLPSLTARLMLQLRHEVTRAGEFAASGFVPLPFNLPKVLAAERGAVVQALDGLVAAGLVEIDGSGAFRVADPSAFERQLTYLELKSRVEPDR